MLIKPTNPALRLVKELCETDSIAELAEKLNSGDWIAICAAPDRAREGRYLFSLGRVND